MKLTLAIVLAVASLAAQAACDVEYVLTPVWGESPRRFDVRLTFEAGGRRSTHLEISTEWGGVTDWAKYMSEFPPIIDHAPNGRIEVRYQVINAVANVDAQSAIDHRDTYRNLFGSTYFTAFGHGLFVVPREAAGDGKRYCVEFTGMPAQWSFASSYGAGQSEGRVRYEITSSMDTLRHSLFLGGDFRVIKREVEGRPLYMALRGTWSFDDSRFADETARLVEGQRRFWSDYDFPYFLISLLPNRVPSGSTGGTAVFNAFAMHASRDFAIPGEGFNYLIGHEHLHTWMPFRLGLQKGEAQQASEYWFSEGFTDFLTHRLLLRAGVLTLEDYARVMNSAVERYLGSPALTASNERVTREFWTDRDVGRIPYLRGEMVALRWDARLRAAGSSMEDTLRGLKMTRDRKSSYEAIDPKALAVNRLRNSLSATLGPPLEADFATYVDRGEPVPIDTTFLGPCFSGRPEDRPRFELGFDTASVAKRRLIGVVPGSAAERAGLRDGMELAGWSIYFGDVTKDVVMQVRGDDGRVHDFEYKPVASTPLRTMAFHVNPDARVEPACRTWQAG